ncbi:MAG TPA: hypothetical protein VKU41_04835 [Polyangiaceae bacterium]|nr:hypothetical protein [Polyangiaceae bacterium]
MLARTLWPTFSPLVKWDLMFSSRGKLETLTYEQIRAAIRRSREPRAAAPTAAAEPRQRTP